MRFRAISWVLAAALVLGGGVLSGCDHTRHVGSNGSVRIALTEYRVNPQSVSATSGTLTMLIHNYGRLTHNLVVSQNGSSIATTPGIPPGGEVALALSLAPGKYLMTSTIQSDQALGQYGTITVH